MRARILVGKKKLLAKFGRGTGRPAFTGICDRLNIQLTGGAVVKTIKQAKYLVVILNEIFKFNNHVRTVIKIANFALSLVHPLLRKNNGLLNDTRLLIYK